MEWGGDEGRDEGGGKVMAQTPIADPLCARPGCGHPESDHVVEDDNSYCVGCVGSAEPIACRCRRFQPPIIEYEECA